MANLDIGIDIAGNYHSQMVFLFSQLLSEPCFLRLAKADLIIHIAKN
jgi:hypothetical protein